MKHAKTAALVAGSVVALGTGAPAFAAAAPAGNPTSPSMSVNGALEDTLSKDHVGEKLDPVTDTAAGVTRSVKDGHGATASPLGQLGQLGQNNQLGSLGALTQVVQPLLGGLPVNGLG